MPGACEVCGAVGHFGNLKTSDGLWRKVHRWYCYEHAHDFFPGGKLPTRVEPQAQSVDKGSGAIRAAVNDKVVDQFSDPLEWLLGGGSGHRETPGSYQSASGSRAAGTPSARQNARQGNQRRKGQR